MAEDVIVPVLRCILVHSGAFDIVLHSIHTYYIFVVHSINMTISCVLAHSIFPVVNYFISSVVVAHPALNFISLVMSHEFADRRRVCVYVFFFAYLWLIYCHQRMS